MLGGTTRPILPHLPGPPPSYIQTLKLIVLAYLRPPTICPFVCLLAMSSTAAL